MIAAFDDRQPCFAGAENIQLRRLGGEVFEGEIEALAKLLDVVGADLVLGLYVVNLGQLGLWLGQAARPLTVVGQDQQAGGVVVQAPGNVQVVAPGGRQQVEHGAVLRIAGGADAAHGLVQHQVARRAAGLQQLLVHLDTAELATLVQRVGGDQAIHAHTPETVEAHGGRSRQIGAQSSESRAIALP